MPPRGRRGQAIDGLLDALVRSGRRLLGADLVVLAVGPPGEEVVRAAAGRDGPGAYPSPGSRLAVRGPVREGSLTAAELSAGDGSAWTVDPGGGPAYLLARRQDGARLLVVVRVPEQPPPAGTAVAHLADLAAELLQAERAAVLGGVRASLHEREDERRRWARELHDETLQQLGALQVLLTSALRQWRAGAEPARLAEAVRVATELLAAQIGGLRQLITELRPAALDDLGLVPPLQALARRTEQLAGIRVSLHVSLRYADGVAATRLVPDAELAIYRVVQEALTNVRRHSSATRAAVTVVEDDDVVVAEISDDGAGFDPDRAGFGVEGMRERAELAGGVLHVGPAGRDGKGTVVRLVVPALHRPPT